MHCYRGRGSYFGSPIFPQASPRAVWHNACGKLTEWCTNSCGCNLSCGNSPIVATKCPPPRGSSFRPRALKVSNPDDRMSMQFIDKLVPHSCLALLRLDYVSCALTILSTVLIGRRLWHGWVVAGANSIIICVIGIRTAQFGFVPANLFCIALYAYNLLIWRRSC